VTGYLHQRYAQSLAEFGTPRELAQCRGWILERQIPGSALRDAMGCYPLFVCQDWSQLHADLDALVGNLVSLALVTDPFGNYELPYLQRCFDLVIPYKEHFVTDLHQPMKAIASKHHRKYARKALREVQVERCTDPTQHLDEWVDLYATLIERHDINGIQEFSRQAFAQQLETPGIEMFRVVHQGATVGANLIYLQGEIAYGHLSAFSPKGYSLGAPYAVKWAVMEYLSNEAHWLDLGAGAGVTANGTDGLSRFKRGWSTGTRTAYFCGRIFNRNAYEAIVNSKGITETDYFPAYRDGEFA